MDASYDLILAAINRLRATSAVTALVGTKIYDRVPEDQSGNPAVTFPYISIGPSTSIPADYDCLAGEEVTIQFDAWSSGAGEAYGSVQVRKIADAIKQALHDTELTLTTNALVSLQWETTRVVKDPNPAINHAVVMLTAEVETP